MQNAVYLAVVAAEAVAALGALGQRALVAAGPALSGTLLTKTRMKAAFYDREHLGGKEAIVNDNSGTHHWAATVTLLSLLHQTISTHRRIQKL